MILKRNLERVKGHLNVRTIAHAPIPCTHTNTRIVAMVSQVSEVCLSSSALQVKKNKKPLSGGDLSLQTLLTHKENM